MDIWLLDILTMMLQLHQIRFEGDYELRIWMIIIPEQSEESH
jgi:hypothetical protein